MGWPCIDVLGFNIDPLSKWSRLMRAHCRRAVENDPDHQDTSAVFVRSRFGFVFSVPLDCGSEGAATHRIPCVFAGASHSEMSIVAMVHYFHAHVAAFDGSFSSSFITQQSAVSCHHPVPSPTT